MVYFCWLHNLMLTLNSTSCGLTRLLTSAILLSGSTLPSRGSTCLCLDGWAHCVGSGSSTGCSSNFCNGTPLPQLLIPLLNFFTSDFLLLLIRRCAGLRGPNRAAAFYRFYLIISLYPPSWGGHSILLLILRTLAILWTLPIFHHTN